MYTINWSLHSQLVQKAVFLFGMSFFDIIVIMHKNHTRARALPTPNISVFDAKRRTRIHTLIAGFKKKTSSLNHRWTQKIGTKESSQSQKIKDPIIPKDGKMWGKNRILTIKVIPIIYGRHWVLLLSKREVVEIEKTLPVVIAAVWEKLVKASGRARAKG